MKYIDDNNIRDSGTEACRLSEELDICIMESVGQGAAIKLLAIPPSAVEDIFNVTSDVESIIKAGVMEELL